MAITEGDWANLAANVESMQTQQTEIREAMRDVDLAIRGDGMGGPGLAHRVVQLEQFQEQIQGLVRWVTFGVLGLFANLLWEIVHAYLAAKGD